MGGWMADNPELADELFTERCPEPYKTQIENGDITPGDVPWHVAGDIWLAVDLAYADRLADAGDALLERRKYGEFDKG